MTDTNNLIWIDLEMTGLDTQFDEIIEIATIVTDKDLQIIEEGPAIAIHHPRSRLEQMDEWNTSHHGNSGLTKRVIESEVSTEEAEQTTIAFLQRHVKKGASPMCGNSICQDRRFLARLMPNLEAWFHYRNLDVSSLKILAQLWRPDVAAGVEKGSAHLALEDIRDSINELRYYRDNFIRLQIANR